MEDIWGVIFGFIDRGSDYKVVALISKRFNAIIRATHPTADEKFANHLLTLHKLFPGKIDPKTLYNANIPLDYIFEHPEIEWSPHSLSIHPNFIFCRRLKIIHGNL